MIDQNKIDEILLKSKEIDNRIEQKKKEQQYISNKLIQLKTKKEQVLEELKNLNVSENELDSKIEIIYKELINDIDRFVENSK